MKIVGTIQFIIVIFNLILPICSTAQQVYLVQGKRRVPFPSIHATQARIGVWTDTDTLAYDSKSDYGWEPGWVTKDSFQVKRALKIADSIVLRNIGRYPEGYRYRSDFKKDGIKYTRLMKVLEYQYRVFAFKDVRKLQYPTYSGNGSGCIGCFFIPGFNIAFLLWAIHRYDARLINMGEWRVEEG